MRIPSYPKIFTIGSSGTENALIGSNIRIEEKVDGSQFSFGINSEGELVFKSKSVMLDRHTPDNLFKEAVEYLMTIEDSILKAFSPNTYFYGECLKRPKHNTLKYGRVPKNNIVLFDCLCNGRWLESGEVKDKAEYLGIDKIPSFEAPKKITLEYLKELFVTESFLGEEKIEGVVIKNNSQTIFLGGNLYPLYTKYVREEFKERHKVAWASNNTDTIENFIKSFKSEARWLKAFYYLRDAGIIENAPKDIAALCSRVVQDIKEEEMENIKNELYRFFIKDIQRTSVKGLPEWYKEKLIKDTIKEEA